MDNPFSRSGFDTLIGADTAIVGGTLLLGTDCTAQIDGTFSGYSIRETKAPDLTDAGLIEKLRSRSAGKRSTLCIGGSVTVAGDVDVQNVTVTGTLVCDELIVHGQLSVKSGAKITATVVRYRKLHIEPGAVLMAQMEHLDHADHESTGEPDSEATK